MYKAIAVSVITAVVSFASPSLRAQPPAPLHVLKIVAGPAGVEEFGDGSVQELPQIVQVNRPGGWAVLAAGAVAPKMPKAADPPRVGDRCYSMQSTSTGGRILLEGQITGVTGGTGDGAGWLASFVNGNGSSGAPVVNEFGETIGVLGVAKSLNLSHLQRDASTIEFGNIPMMPMSAIQARGSARASFAELRARGELFAPLVLETHVLSGGFALGIDRGPIVRPDAQREEFSIKDKEFVVFVTWSPRDRLKGQVLFHVYDAGNRLIGSSKPRKVDLRKTDLVLSSWKIPVIPRPGLYRAEVHLDGKAAWRGYVRITP